MDIFEMLKKLFADPKTYLAIVISAFTIGGIISMAQADRTSHDSSLVETRLMLSQHVDQLKGIEQKTTRDMIQIRDSLDELVRLSQISCIQNAKNDVARMTCINTKGF